MPFVVFHQKQFFKMLPSQQIKLFKIHETKTSGRPSLVGQVKVAW